MLTEPQCAQRQYPGFCLGSVYYNFYGMSLSLRYTHVGSHAKKLLMILFRRTSLSAKMTHPATCQNIVTWTFA